MLGSYCFPNKLNNFSKTKHLHHKVYSFKQETQSHCSRKHSIKLGDVTISLIKIIINLIQIELISTALARSFLLKVSFCFVCSSSISLFRTFYHLMIDTTSLASLRGRGCLKRSSFFKKLFRRRIKNFNAKFPHRGSWKEKPEHLQRTRVSQS